MLSFLSLSAAAGGLDFMPQPGPFLAGIWLNKPFRFLKEKHLAQKFFCLTQERMGDSRLWGKMCARERERLCKGPEEGACCKYLTQKK